MGHAVGGQIACNDCSSVAKVARFACEEHDPVRRAEKAEARVAELESVIVQIADDCEHYEDALDTVAIIRKICLKTMPAPSASETSGSARSGSSTADVLPTNSTPAREPEEAGPFGVWECDDWRCDCPRDPAYDKSINPPYVKRCDSCGLERPPKEQASLDCSGACSRACSSEACSRCGMTLGHDPLCSQHPLQRTNDARIDELERARGASDARGGHPPAAVAGPYLEGYADPRTDYTRPHPDWHGPLFSTLKEAGLDRLARETFAEPMSDRKAMILTLLAEVRYRRGLPPKTPEQLGVENNTSWPRSEAPTSRDGVARAFGWRDWAHVVEDSQRDGYTEAGGRGALAASIDQLAEEAQCLIDYVDRFGPKAL